MPIFPLDSHKIYGYKRANLPRVCMGQALNNNNKPGDFNYEKNISTK